MSMRSHYDPIHDTNGEQPQQPRPQQTRVNISSLLAENNPSLEPLEPVEIYNHESDLTIDTDEEQMNDQADVSTMSQQHTFITENPGPSNNNSSDDNNSKQQQQQQAPPPPPAGTFSSTTLTPTKLPSVKIPIDGMINAPKLPSPLKKSMNADPFASPIATGGGNSDINHNNNNNNNNNINTVAGDSSTITDANGSFVNSFQNTGANKRTNQTLLISAKLFHIKKKDGQPLWREDIQYDFLSEVFHNDVVAFTSPYQLSPSGGVQKVNFADLYISTMAYSNKTSKVLRERLLTDKTMSIPVCMVSLLVNVGRMNTTVNFVPEMKSQLRTFHSIPSLQQGKSHDNKILQDSPRLKSILKSWSEAKKHPTKFEELFNQPLVPDTKFPKTNVINLIFMLCCYEHLIFQHFDPVNLENGTSRNFVSESPSFLGEDLTKPDQAPFNCLFLNFKTTPKSRAQRFLWLLYNYLETNLTKEEILNNPFKDPENPLLIPALVPIPDGMNFDIDTPQEVEYAKTMEEVRMNFLKTDGNPDLMENGNKSEKSKDDGGSEKPKKGGRAVRNSGKSAKAAGNNGNNNNNTNNNKKVGDSKNNTAKPKPDDIHKEIFKNNKARSKFQRHYNGNIMYLTHSILNDELIEEEDAKFDGDGKIVSREVGNRKKRYNGDFGEFATTCLKMFKAGKNYHEAHYLEQAKNGENEVKVELKLGEDGTTISGFSIDI